LHSFFDIKIKLPNMLLPLHLLPLAVLTVPAAAFIPYHLPDEAGEAHGEHQARTLDFSKRSPFYIWSPEEEGSGDETNKLPSLRFSRSPPKVGHILTSGSV
jgi:hypothetical protein